MACQVHIDIYGLHHDPALWDEPERFRPERFLSKAEAAGRHPNAFMPFGQSCLWGELLWWGPGWRGE